MSSEREHPTNDELVRLVRWAIDGDEAAWNELVERLGRVVWKAVNMMTTDTDIRDDAYAATWLRLAERLDTIREPQKLPGWLATTAVNEARLLLRRRYRDDDRRDSTTDAAARLDQVSVDDGDFAQRIVAEENRRDIRRAFAKMDLMSREILTVLVVTDPPPSYADAADMLGRPIGSLGPMRRRALEQLHSFLMEEKAE